MERPEFIDKTVKLVANYAELHEEGCIGVDQNSIHLNATAMFTRFDKADCRQSFHDSVYPTRYDIDEAGTNFFCITFEPWEDRNGVVNPAVGEGAKS